MCLLKSARSPSASQLPPSHTHIPLTVQILVKSNIRGVGFVAPKEPTHPEPFRLATEGRHRAHEATMQARLEAERRAVSGASRSAADEGRPWAGLLCGAAAECCLKIVSNKEHPQEERQRRVCRDARGAAVCARSHVPTFPLALRNRRRSASAACLRARCRPRPRCPRCRRAPSRASSRCRRLTGVCFVCFVCFAAVQEFSRPGQNGRIKKGMGPSSVRVYVIKPRPHQTPPQQSHNAAGCALRRATRRR